MDELITDPLGDAAFISQRDIWDAAMEFISRYGDMAAIEATKRADYFLEAGDLAGQRTWLRVVHAIGDFLDCEVAVGH